MTIGEVIKQYREDHEMSMDSFAKKSGLSKAYISLLEKNKHPKTGRPIAPSIKIIRQVSNAMGRDFDELFSLLEGEVIVPETSTTPTPPQDSPNAAPTEPPDLSDRAVYCARLFDNAEARTQDDVILLLENHQKGERGSTLTNTA